MLYRVFVERVVGLQSGNECGCSDIITTVIDQCHLTLKITDVALECFFMFHLDREEMVVLLKFLSRGILVKEDTANLSGETAMGASRTNLRPHP